VNDYEGKMLCERTGWTPAEVVRRWAIYTKWTEPRFMAAVERVLREENLGDDALQARERRARAERARMGPQASAEFDSESYETTLARRRAASAPIPGAPSGPPVEPPREAAQETTPDAGG